VQIEYNNSINKWTYVEEKQDDTNSNDTTGQVQVEETEKTSVLDSFNKHGFETPDWKGTIYEEYVTLCRQTFYNGAVWVKPTDDYHYMKPISWDKQGRVIHNHVQERWVESYNLTPLSKYPLFKKNNRHEGIYKVTSAEEPMICVLSSTPSNIGDKVTMFSEGNTNWSDVVYDSERGLYDGQPCYGNFSDDKVTTTIGFYNIATGNLHNDNAEDLPEFFDYSNIEAIPIETLKHMPFIWDMYKTLKESTQTN